jgi:hypothetical protein
VKLPTTGMKAVAATMEVGGEEAMASVEGDEASP